LNIFSTLKRYYSYYQNLKGLDRNSYFLTVNTRITDDLGAMQGHKLIPLIRDSLEYAEKNIIKEKDIKNSFLLNIFPGEHYRILSGLIKTIKPKKILDIGTHTGMSARIMLDYSDQKTEIKTIDLIKWNQFKDTHLCNEDFQIRKFSQELIDLSDKSTFKEYSALFNDVDIIFTDGPKDGKFEYDFLENLNSLKLDKKQSYLIIDDIRFLNMVKLWRNILSPKLDITSFGHFCGTGLVDISEGLQINKKIFENNIRQNLKRNVIN